LPQTLNLNVIERKPLGIFCPRTSSGQVSGCFLIDNNGVIFESSEIASNNNLVVRPPLNSNEQISIGEQAVAQNVIDVIYKIQKNLKDNFQIDLKEVLIVNSLRLNIETSENWEIYFDLDDTNSNVGSQIEKLNLLLDGDISFGKRDNLRYIDLRPKDRAIVCDNPTCGSFKK
jgi:hypothetical protein